MNDIVSITDLVLRERQARDRGWWRHMAECYHADSHVRVTWFEGTGPEFVRMSAELVSPAGRAPVHHMSPPVVTVREERAVVEVPGIISSRVIVHGVDAELSSWIRILYRVERDEGQWRIRSLECIYESDSLRPVAPDEVIPFDAEQLAGMREAYRFFAYRLTSIGKTPPNDLWGDDQPDRVTQLYAESFAWLGLPEAIDNH